MAKKTIWNFFDSLEGDKVVWIITLMLILISIVCIFSSSSRLLVGDQTRLDIVKSQLIIVLLGLAVITGCYFIKKMSIIRIGASFGLFVSLILLLLLVSKVNIPGVIKSIELNKARRILQVGGFQIHVFEVVKVAMVLYLAWVQDAIKRKAIRWIKDEKRQKILLIYAPFLLIILLVLPGSNSAAMFIGFIMFITILIGGGHFKDLSILALSAVAAIFLCWSIYKVSGGKAFERIGTAVSRVFDDENLEEKVMNSKFGSKDYYDALDELRQPYGSKIAIHQGGFLGKGPGQSTQRYVVPDMSEDYMFSFIIEEYGVLGALVVIFLYVSLMARGALIARNCNKDNFAKLCVAGLSLLITGQAFLHMFVNVDIGPMTGQTLPLISHGNSAFLCFCVAFGIILSISRLTKREMKNIQDKADSLLDQTETTAQQTENYGSI